MCQYDEDSDLEIDVPTTAILLGLQFYRVSDMLVLWDSDMKWTTSAIETCTQTHAQELYDSVDRDQDTTHPVPRG